MFQTALDINELYGLCYVCSVYIEFEWSEIFKEYFKVMSEYCVVQTHAQCDTVHN
jgi:hypothetical protein